MSMTSEEILTAMQTIVAKAVNEAQAATDHKLTSMQTATDQKFTAMQASIDKAQAATDQKLTLMQATIDKAQTATDKKIVTTQKETIDILREDMQNIAEATANKFVQRIQAILENREDKQIQLIMEDVQEILRRLPPVENQRETTNEITTLKHIVADHSVRIKKLEEATFKKA